MKQIAVFDSGLGGISVLHEIRRELPRADLVYYGDSLHNPYGTKTAEEIVDRCISICDGFVQNGASAIVVACNTATSAAVKTLRARYAIPVIGMEPALKPATDAGFETIAVWATDFTLKEKKFANLMDRYAPGHTIIKVACPKLVRLVEEDRLDDETAVQAALEEYLAASAGADCIVLGCTHFPFFKEKIAALAPDVALIDGNAGTAHHLKEMVDGDTLAGCGTLEWQNSNSALVPLGKRLYQRLEDSYGKQK